MCFPSSVSHQPRQTGPLSGQPLAGARDNKLSTSPNFHPSIFHPPFSLFLLACIFIAPFPPSRKNIFFLFFIPSPFFSFISSLSLVPPLLLARLSHFSLPHFLCALQWFFRFFPIYDLPLSPRLCPSKPSNSFTTPLPAVAAHGS